MKRELVVLITLLSVFTFSQKITFGLTNILI